jgi:serine/threonine-protein kinase RsbW
MAATIIFPAQMESLAQALAFVVDCATTAGFPPQRVTEIELAVEEAVVNICQYAYVDKVGMVEMRCTRDQTQQFLIELIDTGEPFNLLTLPLPDLTADLDHRPIGGWGVLLIRSLIDKVTYRREGDRNILQFTVQGHREMQEASP